MIKQLLKELYKAIPFKRQIFSLLKPLRMSEKITKHLTFKGIIKVNLGNGQHIYLNNEGYALEQKFFWKGLDAWEKNSNLLWRTLVKRSSVIFDIGANTGIYTIVAKKVNPAATVFAFEPVKRIYDVLIKNIEINKYEKVVAINEAVSDKKGQFEFFDSEDDNLYEASLEKSHADSLPYLKKSIIHYTVNVETVENVILDYKLNHIDLMKIDVESHEPSVIKGMGTYLQKFRPIIIIEILNEKVAAGLTPFFPIGQYLFYNINEERGFESVNTLSPSSHYNFIICPAEKHDLLKEVFTEISKQ